jgi:uncharacterized protein YcaQ
VARAHHLTLASRFDHYRPPALAHLLEETRVLFEHWTHDAAAIPTRWFPHWHHRFALQRRRIEASNWWRERLGSKPASLLERIERRVRDEGPVLAKDFLDPEAKPKKTGWWEWRPEKAALEYLWHTGRLAVVRRDGFQKVYDLTERVLPDHHALPPPAGDEHADWAARSALDRLGVATPRELAAFWYLLSADQAAAWCAAHVEQATSSACASTRGRDGGVRAGRLGPARPPHPEPPDRIRLLRPFDPRRARPRRALRLFAFDYRFEAFVPAPRRVRLLRAADARARSPQSAHRTEARSRDGRARRARPVVGARGATDARPPRRSGGRARAAGLDGRRANDPSPPRLTAAERWRVSRVLPCRPGPSSSSRSSPDSSGP